MGYDFGGYATRNNLKCADGRTILPGAFKDCDGQTVPMVWQHVHDNPDNVLGHALLENRDDGVYAYCTFNETNGGKTAKELVKHGDVRHLSIYANHLKQRGGEVLHGVIREVSLVLAGANPGAYIDNLSFAHSDGTIDTVDDEAVIKLITDDNGFELMHSDDEGEETVEDVINSMNDTQKKVLFWLLEQERGEVKHDGMGEGGEGGEAAPAPEGDPEAEPEPEGEPEEGEEDPEGEESPESILKGLTDRQKTAVDVVIKAALSNGKYVVDEEVTDCFNSLTEKQKEAVYQMVDAELADQESGEEIEHSDTEGETMTMHYNVFAGETGDDTVLTHDDMARIFADAKSNGSLKEAVLAHGITNIEVLFPEVQGVNKTPYQITRQMEWVKVVMNGVHKTPFSRIKSTAANFTMEEARARGYIKGNQKIEEQFTALKRITTPTTVYKLQKLDRDDIVDITDFDVVAFMKDEMRTMLEEEMARAILIGDGRSSSDESKINPLNIRPVWTDEATYTVNKIVNVTGMTLEQKAKEFVDSVVRSKLDYKGSGTPTMFISPELLVELRLLRDADGYRRYKTDQELADDLRVSKIVEVELFNGLKRTFEGVERELGAIILNMGDYTVGATKGGEVTLFDDFDLNFNKYEYLIETRCCGALTKPFSAIVIEFTGTSDVNVYSLANLVPASAKNPQTAGFYYFDGKEYIAASETTIDQEKIYYALKGATGSTGATGGTGATGATGQTGNTGQSA